MVKHILSIILKIKIAQITNEVFLYHRLFIGITLLTIAMFLSSVTSAPGSSEKSPPSLDWKLSTPESLGVDPDRLYKVEDEILAKFPDLYSLLIIKNGRLIFEDYYKFGEQGMIAPVHSVTKSVMSTLIGIAIEKKYIQSVDQKVSEFFPELFHKDLEPAKKDITIKQLLTMTPGFEWHDRGEIFWEWFFSSDFIKFTLESDLETPPGEIFNYSTAVSHILSGILTRATGKTSLEFAKEHLFAPLGIKEAKWSDGPAGFSRGGMGLQLSARDLAKIGQLYLNNGIWEGKSIIPKSWVEASSTHQVEAEHGYGYGYQWWVKEVVGCPSYRAWGRGGQFIVIVPSLEMVMVVTSKFDLPLPPTYHYSALFDQIVTAVKENKCSPIGENLTKTTQETPEDTSSQCQHTVDLPDGVKTFLDEYAIAFKNKDLKNALTHYSEDFLLNGRDKEGSRKMLSSLFKQIPINSICIQLHEFNQQGEIANIAGTLHLNSRASTLIIPKLIQENGRWKWYGNQRNKPGSKLDIPADINTFINNYCAAILSQNKEKMAAFFTDDFSSRGFTKETFLAYVTPLYKDIDSVEIELTDLQTKGDSIYVKGLFKTKPLGTSPLMFNHIERKNGKLLWAGTKGLSDQRE